MVGKKDHLSMGGNENGGSGLWLNEDLSKGNSSKAHGFDNDPLAGEKYPDFNVGVVEVYHLVREIDGKPIDGDMNIWDEDAFR